MKKISIIITIAMLLFAVSLASAQEATAEPQQPTVSALDAIQAVQANYTTEADIFFAIVEGNCWVVWHHRHTRSN
jgi:ABC-type transporter MlaC component